MKPGNLERLTSSKTKRKFYDFDFEKFIFNI